MTYDKAIFVFNASFHEREDVEKLTRQECEEMCNSNSDTVSKYDLEGDSLQDLINNQELDNFSSDWVRVFLSPMDDTI